MNTENFKKVLNQITAYPETWDQTDWHCGTTHCFAGWAQLLSGNPANLDTVRRDARIYLDLSGRDADFLFAPSRTQEDFRRFRNGYNRDGYDRNRYDRDGYDCDGLDCDGYNRAGYSRAGYDRDGYDRDGLDRNNKPQTTKEGA